MKTLLLAMSLLAVTTSVFAANGEKMRGGIAISQLRETNLGAAEDEGGLVGELTDSKSWCLLLFKFDSKGRYVMKMYNDGQDVIASATIAPNKYVTFEQVDTGDSDMAVDRYKVGRKTIDFTTFEDGSNMIFAITGTNGETVACKIAE